MGLTKYTFITDTQMQRARYAKETFYIHKSEILDLFQCKPGEYPNFPRFQGNISQEPIKLFYQKLYLNLMWADYQKM